MKVATLVSITEFKADMTRLLNQVARTRCAITVTRRGKPYVQIVPPAGTSGNKPVCGSLAHTVVYMGDVVSPVCQDDWEAAR